ncbi:proliferation marker protein Ki-67 isoform X3 [Struthio camelus]|uniref:proliferation marker protein Ki-67 isoform X3 n=1 Tax=Struthio camelus TaxID=8801 RepID=UPI00360404C2
MPLFGKIVVIKRTGTDGIHFPLTASSCLFGRKIECDIRIQLPQVSKEHCKIEVNENKEAILTNLSTVNPTQLNGGCFQQPVALKHGDVFTIIDRSFRFEYPPQSAPRKRCSRSPKNETLQVAEVELLHKQTSGSKSLLDSDNTECEEQNADENKRSTEGNISKTLPVKLLTPKSLYRVHRSNKKENEMSPFSKLYETLKHEIEVKKVLKEGNVSQQAGKEDGKSILLEPSAQTSSSGYAYGLGSLTKEKEIDVSEAIEEYKMKQEVIGSEFNPISTAGSATKKSFTRSPRTSASNEMSRDIGKRILLQDHKEQNISGKSDGTEVATKPNKDNDGNAACSPKPCSIERLGYADNIKIYSSAKKKEQLAQTSAVTNATSVETSVSEIDNCVLSTPRLKRKSPRSRSISSTKVTSEMGSLNTDTPTVQHDILLECKTFSGIAAEPQKEDLVCRNDSLKQLPLAENRCLKQRRNSKQHTPGKSVKEEVLKETCDQDNFVNSKERDSDTPASSSNSKSPRRNSRRGKELSNKSVYSETLTSEELTPEPASPASQKSSPGRKRGRPRTSGPLTKKVLETDAAQDHHDKTVDRKDSGSKEELAYQQKLDLEDGGVLRPRRLSSKRRSGSATILKEDEVVTEMSISSLLDEEEESGNTRISQKRKSGDLLLQPLGKRKRVSFGGHLSPELFDKSLPPNSPLKRGAIPARLSLPFGNSPRAVLKKAQGLKRFAIQEISEHLPKQKVSPKNLLTQRSAAASSLVSGTPKFTLSSPAPYTKGRFSVSRVTTPSPVAEEQDAVAEDVNTQEENGAQVKTLNFSHVNQDDKTLTATTNKLTRSAQLALKNTPMKRRSGAVAVINAKRRSGASSANLLVAKSWAEVVKLGVARPQAKAIKKSVLKGRSAKKITQSPKTPERKVKGHFSTGHAESPATIVVGRAYTTRVRMAGQVPKVVKNPILKQNMDMDESFTGLTELLQTPEDKSGKRLPLSAVQKTDFTPMCTAVEVSELHTPEESGEMIVSPLNSSDASEQKQDSQVICHFLRDEESLKSMVDAISTNTPEKKGAMLEENVSMDSLLISPEKHTSPMKLRIQRRTPKQKLEPVEVLSGIKQLMRTPKQKSEPVEVLSGIKQLMRTPKQKSEPVEALSGVKQLMRTPKQKSEPVEALSGVKQLMRTPKQKSEPVEALSGVKQLMRTPKQKSEPVEALSGVKQLMRTPKQKSEPVEALSGVKQLMRTPKQKSEPVEALSGVKQLMRTPKQKSEPVEALSGVKQLMRTPKQKSEPITDEIAFTRLLKTPVEGVEDIAGVTLIKKTPKLKYQPVEDMIGVSRIFKTPKEKVEPVEDVFGISRLVRTPREKYQPVEDFVGLKKLMAEPRQKCSDFEVDYVGVKEMFDIPEEIKVRSTNTMDLEREDSVPVCTNSNQEYEDKGNFSEGEDSQQTISASKDHSTKRQTRGRPRKTVHPVSVKQREKILEEEVNLKELQALEKKSPQEGMGEAGDSTTVAKNLGRGKRTNLCMQEGIVSKHPDHEKAETKSFVELRGAAQRSRRGKKKELTVLKHQSESAEESLSQNSVLQKEPANIKQTLQEYDINAVLIAEDGQSIKTESMYSSIQNANCRLLQTEFKKTENKSNESSIENNEEILLSPGKTSRGEKKVETTEPVIPPKRVRRGKNDSVKQSPSEELHGTVRKLREAPSAKMIQGDEQTVDKGIIETAPVEESEIGTKHEIKVVEKRGKSLRNARKHLTEIKTEACRVAPENMKNAQENKETSVQTVIETRSRMKNENKVCQGDEAENVQENATEASQTLKSESPFGETNKAPATVLYLETNRSTIQETNRTRNRRVKKGSLEIKTDESAKDVSSLKVIVPKLKSETELEESSIKDSLGSPHVKEDMSNSAATAIAAADNDSIAHSCQKQTENEQEVHKPHQIETLPESQTHVNGTTFRRGRGKKVNFELEEANAKALGGKSFLGEDKGIIYKDGQHDTSENASSQVRRSRRKQVDSIPPTACPTSTKNQTLIEDHSKDETFVKDQDPALEATLSSTEENPLRWGKRGEAAVASQTTSSLSVRKKRGLPEGDDKKMAVKEDQNMALGNKTSQAKANAAARDRREKIDLSAEAKSSSSLQRKCGLSETDDKEESSNEEQNMPLEVVSPAKEKTLGRGRRKVAALMSHTTNYISLRGRRCVPADNDREETLKEDQNVPLETAASSVKETQLRKGRRKEVALLLEATRSTSIHGKDSVSKESGKKNAYGEAEKMILENSTSQEEMNLSKGKSRQKAIVTSLASGSTSPQGKISLPDSGKNETPKEQQSLSLEMVPSARENLSRAGRKKTVSFKSEEADSTFLRGKRYLPKDTGQKETLKEGENASPDNNSSQERTRLLRNKRKKVEFVSEAAPSTSLHDNGNLPENGNTPKTRNTYLKSTDPEKNNPSRKGKEVNLIPQTTSTSRRRKCQLSEDNLASKKLKSENDESRSLQKGKRNKTKEELDEGNRATQTAGGTDRKTRSSTRTRK